MADTWSREELERLWTQAKTGNLDGKDAVEIGLALEWYVTAMGRMERAIHWLTKGN